MKPNFALTLSFDGIGLLHRVPSGWHRVGDVALDVPDLPAALADLRNDALLLEPDGLRAKLVIPNEQIRYLTIDMPDASDDDLPALVAAALDGATPYAVNDLVYDWTRDGTRTHIAAVAGETLSEAEAFANEHAFNPVSFVAIPAEGDFLGEPFFGAAPSAAEWLDSTDSLLRDMQPVKVIGVATLPAPAPEESAGTPGNTPDTEETVETPPAADPAQAQPEATPPTDDDTATPDQDETPDVVADATASEGDDTPPNAERDDTADETADDAVATDAAVAMAVPTQTPEVPAFSSIRAQRGEVPPPPPRAVSPTAPVIDLDDDELPDAPPVTGQAPSARDEDEVTFAASATATRGGSGRLSGFLSRRGDATDKPAPAAAVAAPAPPAPSMASGESERERMTIFGARKQAKPKEQVVGGKPRYLGLVLTAALLLFLAAVAAWASIFSEDGFSRLFGTDETQMAALPDVEETDTLEVEGAEAAPPEDDIELTAVNPAIAPADLASDVDLPLSISQGPTELTDEEAATRYAVTGIWQRAPQQPDTPGFTQLSELYTASIDPQVSTGDAVALPSLQSLLGDRVPGPQSSPAAPGTQFDMDDRGMVRATPEGAITPDGVRVIAGRPPVVPARLPTRFEETPQVNEEIARLAAFRPRVRPGDLVQQNERSNLGGLTRNELAQIRPKLRPAVEKAEEEVDETATAQAVALSLKPRPRPGDFARTVQRAEATPEPTEVAAVAPRTVSPSVPSRASVAKQATVRNAINLRKVNLIGVYGKPSSRRALIRMSNGRYKKVKVGDVLDGGRVAAIGESELRYTKGGRSIVLTMPRG